MKKFIYSLSKFFVGFGFILITVLFLASALHRFQPTEMYYYEDFQSFNKSNFEVLALGNSKLLSSIDKKTFEDNIGVNLGMLGYSSANISTSKLILESYLNKNAITPNLILLEVSWFTFNDKRTNLHPIVGELFLKDIELLKNYDNYKYKEILPKILSAVLNSFKSQFKTKAETSYSKRFKKSTPFMKSYVFNLDDFERVFPNHKAGIDQKLLKDFIELVELCEQHSIPLIMYTAPEDSKYVSLQEDKYEIKAIFKNLANNDDIFYLDYTPGSCLWDLEFENWLKDSHHINERNLFSKKILEDIRKIIPFSDIKKKTF